METPHTHWCRWMSHVVTVTFVALLLGLSTPTMAAMVAVGGQHTCATMNDTQVQCWGDNSFGQLGDSKVIAALNFTPVSVNLGTTSPVIGLAAGIQHNCALTQSGTVICWGMNNQGQLGNGTTANPNQPQGVKGISGGKYIATGDNHSCVILGNGKVMCWGSNTKGQLGNGSTVSSAVPVEVNSLSNVSQIALGNSFSCAMLTSGDVQCWGSNDFGQLGDGSKIPKLAPAKIINLGGKKATNITAGSDHACVRLTDNTVKCWGWNGHFQQGEKVTSGDNYLPVDVKVLGTVSAIAAGSDFTCAITTVKTIKCLGGNNVGQLGAGSLGSLAGYPTPQTVVNVAGAFAMDAGPSAGACALTTGNVLKCWGGGGKGQLGVDPKTLQTCGAGLPCTPSSVIVSFAPPAKSTPAPIAIAPTSLQPVQQQSSPAWYQRVASPIPSTAQAVRALPITDTARGGTPSGTPPGQGAGTSSQGSGGSAGGTPVQPNGDIKKYWTDNQTKFLTLHDQLVAASLTKIAAQKALRDDVKSSFGMVSDVLLTNKWSPKCCFDNMASVIDKKSALSAALTTQGDLFKQLHALWLGLLKSESTNDKPDAEKSGILFKGSAIYLSGLFSTITEQTLDTKDCGNPIKEKQLFTYLNDPAASKSALAQITLELNCLPQDKLNLLDDRLTTAFALTNEMTKAVRPSFSGYFEENALGKISPIAITMNARTRRYGTMAPSTHLLNMYLKYLNDPVSAASTTPPVFYLQNPKTKKMDEITTCSGVDLKNLNKAMYYPSLPVPITEGAGAKTPSGILYSQLQTFCAKPPAAYPVWVGNTLQGCMIWKNFVNVFANPVMQGLGTGSVWDYDLFGKPYCVLSPVPVKTSMNEPRHPSLLKQLGVMLQEFFIPSAYAGECLLCGKCDDKSAELVAGSATCSSCKKEQDDLASAAKNLKWLTTASGMQFPSCKGAMDLYDTSNVYSTNGMNDLICVAGSACTCAFKYQLDVCLKKSSCCPAPKTPIPDDNKDKDKNKEDKNKCYDSCLSKNLPACQPMLGFLEDVKTGTCVMPTKLQDSDGKTLCLPGTPCSCAMKPLAKDCFGAQTSCKANCNQLYGPKDVDTKNPTAKECNDWLTNYQPSWNNGFGTLAFPSPAEAQALSNSDPKIEKAFKEDGTKKLDNIFPLVMQWLEYLTGAQLPKETVENAHYYAKEVLSKSAPCTGSELATVMSLNAGAMTSVCYGDNGCSIGKESICWDPDWAKDMLSDGLAKVGAHEAVHAAFSILLSESGVSISGINTEWLKQFDSEMNFGADLSGYLEHLIIQIIHDTIPNDVANVMTNIGNYHTDQSKTNICK